MYRKYFSGIVAIIMSVCILSCTTQTEDYTRANKENGAQTPPPPGSMYGEENNNAFIQQQAQQKLQQQQQQQAQQQLQAQQAQQTQGAASIRTVGDEKTAHFTCPNGCAGSGADNGGNCPTCGTAYVHNAESPWHEANKQNEAAAANTTPQSAVITGDEKSSHYICPDGCAGSGSPAPGNCPVCQKAYVHNSNSPAHEAELQNQKKN